jgi:hypothetical protein
LCGDGSAANDVCQGRADQFEDIERLEFGGDEFDMAVDKVADIERRLGVADLASFTAPAA